MKILAIVKLRGQKYYPFKASGSGAINNSLWLELPYLDLSWSKMFLSWRSSNVKSKWSAQPSCQKPIQKVLGHLGHGHFGLGRFGLDISAVDVSATENVEGGRFGHNHKFWVWDVCMHKCVMHFIIFWNQICMWILTVDSKMLEKQVKYGVYYTAVNDIYLYKVPITWISLHFLFTTYLVFLWIYWP